MPQAATAVARSGRPGSQSGRSFAENLDAFFEQHTVPILTAFMVLFTITCIITAMKQRLWLDEIYSTFIVNQPSVTDIVRASYAGCDAQPPLFSILVHFIKNVVPYEPLALRLPSIAGFCTMAVCVFALVRRRLGALYAFLATLISICALLYYATEGRSYGLELGFTSLALFYWQRAIRGGARLLDLTGVAISGAFAVAAQYYGIFFLCSLFGAEVIYAIKRRRLDISLSVALLLPLAVLIPHLPLIHASSPFVKHFWSPASFHSATSFYDTFLAQHAWVLVVGPAFYAVAHFWPDARPDEPSTFSTRAWITWAVLSVAPFFVVAAALATVKVYVPRYTIWAVPPIAICIVAGLSYASRGSRLAAACGALPLCMLLALLEAANLHAKPHLRTGQTALMQLETLPQDSRPIFIADNEIFTEVWYYSNPEQRRRLYYAIDTALDLHYGWPDTLPAVMKALRNWTTIQAPDLAPFLAEHPHFLLAAGGRDWMPAYLLSLGYTLKPIRIDRTDGQDTMSVIYDASRL